MEDLKKEVFPVKEKVFACAGAIASVSLITIIISHFGLLNSQIIYAMFLFISLPLAVTFIFSILVNKPNAKIKARKYGTILYIIIMGILYFINFRPESASEILNSTIFFFVALGVITLSSLFYLVTYKLLKNKQFRTKATLSFSVSFVLTLALSLFLSKVNLQLFN